MPISAEEMKVAGVTGPIRRKRDPLAGQKVDDDVVETLRRRSGSGNPLPSHLGQQLGAQLGTDLSDIRVHADPQAGAIARSLQATAFTSGNDLYFAPGAYQPQSSSGLRTLAHELGHVVQQRSGSDTSGGPLRVGAADDPMEAGADRIADRTLAALNSSGAPVAEVAPLAGAGAVGEVRRAWDEEQVATMIRESLPDLRLQLRTINAIQNPWTREAKASALLTRIKSSADEGRASGQFRLGRTLDLALGAVDSLDSLALDVQVCVMEAEAAVLLRRSAIDLKVADYDQLQTETGVVFARLEELAAELSIPITTPKSAVHDGRQAEIDVSTTLDIDDDKLDSLVKAAAEEKRVYQAQLNRLIDARPTLVKYLEAKFKVESTLGDIRDLAEGTEFKSTVIKKLIVDYDKQIKAEVAKAAKSRSLLVDNPLPGLQAATKKLLAIEADMASPENGSLGTLAEEARERFDRVTGPAKVKGQRTALPVLKSSAATGHRAQMLLPAVKESQKSPEWKQAAVDFVEDRLALGRPDHIHICGGGNTLIYDGRLIRGFMTLHLDSRPESKQAANKIKGRPRESPVEVTVKGGILYEVIPG